MDPEDPGATVFQPGSDSEQSDAGGSPLVRAKHIYGTEGMRPLLKRGLAFASSFVFRYQAYYLYMEEDVQTNKYRPAIDFQWSKSGNIWYNSQIRSLPLNIATLFKRSR
jgi:hypothetical protein